MLADLARGAEATGAEGAAAPDIQTVRGQQVALSDKNLYLLFVSGPILRNFQYCTLDLKKH